MKFLCSIFYGECRALMVSISASLTAFLGELRLYIAMLLFCGSNDKDCGLCRFYLFFTIYGFSNSGSGESSLFI